MSERVSSVVDRVMGREMASGEFRRQQSRFRAWVGVDTASGRQGSFTVEAGRYRLRTFLTSLRGAYTLPEAEALLTVP